MCCVPASLYFRLVVRFIVWLFVLLCFFGCHAKTLQSQSPVELVGDKSAPAVPIPEPTSAMPFLPAPLLANSGLANPGLTNPGPPKTALPYQTNNTLTGLDYQTDGTDDRLMTGAENRSAAQLYSRGSFSVVVQNVPAHEVLFALARDSALDLDIIGKVAGSITLNAVNQPLQKILEKISRQVAIRYELTPGSLLVVADTAEIRSYQVDYLNISRSTQSRVDLSTQIGSIRTATEGEPSNSSSNGSQMSIENNSQNRFWQTLTSNIAGIIGEETATSSADAEPKPSVNIFVNRESGIIAVRATDRQHRVIEQLVHEVVGSAKRQVLIEATVVEVTLSDNFESGIDWRILDNNGGTAFDYAQILSATPSASEAITPANELLSYRNSRGSLGDVTATLKLLQQFGEVQVLSSPKIITLNNQPAVLKVVDNRVYFTFEVDRQERENGDLNTVVDSTVHSVPIGLVMNVTPFINSKDEVILNVRPTISRILNFATDPSPALAGQTEIENLIPEIQVREMESVLRVQSGEVAIIGGLMQNKVDNRNTGLPGVGQLPWLGKLFSRDTKKLEKTELLVFLRPTVMKGDDFQRNDDQLRRFVPYQRGQLLMGQSGFGINP